MVEQPDDGLTPEEHEESQAQGAVLTQAGGQQSGKGSEQQPIEAEPAGRPKRSLKKPQKVLEGLESSSQQVSCLISGGVFHVPSIPPQAFSLMLRFLTGSAGTIPASPEQEAKKDV